MGLLPSFGVNRLAPYRSRLAIVSASARPRVALPWNRSTMVCASLPCHIAGVERSVSISVGTQASVMNAHEIGIVQARFPDEIPRFWCCAPPERLVVRPHSTSFRSSRRKMFDG